MLNKSLIEKQHEDGLRQIETHRSFTDCM